MFHQLVLTTLLVAFTLVVADPLPSVKVEITGAGKFATKPLIRQEEKPDAKPDAKPAAEAQAPLPATAAVDGIVAMTEKTAVAVGKDEHSESVSKVEASTVGGAAAFPMDDEEWSDDAALDELEAMTIAKALSGKAPTPAPPPPAENCAYGDWEEADDCSKSCGGGKLKEKRSIIVRAAHKGKPCRPPSSRKKKCNKKACPTTTLAPTTIAMTTAAGANRMVDVCAAPLLSLFVPVWLSIN